MKFYETYLKGAFLIEIEPFLDNRGSFARTFCAEEFKNHGLRHNMVQSNYTITRKKNTLRGLHFQVDGAEEAKLVRCAKGKILDVLLDLEKDSKTFGEHLMVELSQDKNIMVYIPEGFAHGYLSLENDTHIYYQVSNFYNPEKERGIRWNDPFFNINWPVSNPILSVKDKNFKDFHVNE